MWKRSGVAVAVLAFLVLLASLARAEVIAHNPPPPDPATTTPSLLDLAGYEIKIGPVVKIPVRMPDLLRPICRTSRSVVACTFFADEKLECSCKRKGDGWQLQASVWFVPVMYLSSFRHEEHENLHVTDVTERLGKHLAGLVDGRFSTERECRSAASRETRTFHTRMNRFREESNRKYR